MSQQTKHDLEGKLRKFVIEMVGFHLWTKILRAPTSNKKFPGTMFKVSIWYLSPTLSMGKCTTFLPRRNACDNCQLPMTSVTRRNWPDLQKLLSRSWSNTPSLCNPNNDTVFEKKHQCQLMNSWFVYIRLFLHSWICKESLENAW